MSVFLSQPYTNFYMVHSSALQRNIRLFKIMNSPNLLTKKNTSLQENMLFLRRMTDSELVQSFICQYANFWFNENSGEFLWRKFLSVKLSFYENSVRRKVPAPKFPEVKFPLSKIPTTGNTISLYVEQLSQATNLWLKL